MQIGDLCIKRSDYLPVAKQSYCKAPVSFAEQEGSYRNTIGRKHEPAYSQQEHMASYRLRVISNIDRLDSRRE
ncbi:hypothetical protein GCM10011585_08210 [Edaphobacter dinghuensis]|uniref:Uncharacterized protein n=1 Tax=Edaphobacter dinghuensis TaxID=1560005 RepID=A0A917H714_9BACT|nr:hypothetical protein GCM10011585_08210 [Edaphobacter dinghuensis]